jgi:hypothetical protein
MEMRFGTWNVRSLYRAGSLMTVVKEIPKYKSDVVGEQNVGLDRGGTEPDEIARRLHSDLKCQFLF